MNNAVIFIKDKEEKQLARAPYLGGNLLIRTVNELKKVGNLDKIYIVGIKHVVPGCEPADSIEQIISEIGNEEGKTLLVSPLYPEVNGDDYRKMIKKDEPTIMICENELVGQFMIPNNLLAKYKNINYSTYDVKNRRIKKFTLEESNRMKGSSLDDVVIFSLSSSTALGKEVCHYLNVEPGKIEVNHFADGETLVELGESVRGKRVYLIQSTSKPVNENLMELLIAIDACRRSSSREITCIIPYFGYARQDRKAQPRQPITAKLVASMLEEAGADRVVVFDLHAQQIQGFFNCPVDDLTTVPMMGQYFRRKKMDLENTVVVSPDHGGVKRARNLAQLLETPIAIIDKRRPRPNVCEACNIIGEVAGKDAIIVDDICDTGGSLIAASKILKDNGAKDIYVCIAHGLFSNNATTRIEESDIKEVVVSNSITVPVEELKKTSKIKTLSIGWMLSKLILAVQCHTPVSEVYSLYEDNAN